MYLKFVRKSLLFILVCDYKSKKILAILFFSNLSLNQKISLIITHM